MIIYNIYVHVLFLLTVITVTFDQSAYSVAEDVGSVQLVMILSNPSSFVETVQVISTDITALGKQHPVQVVTGFAKEVLYVCTSYF